MKITCPDHYCVLEHKDKIVLENNQGRVEALAIECPFCKVEVRVLNILLGNTSFSKSQPEHANLSDR